MTICPKCQGTGENKPGTFTRCVRCAGRGLLIRGADCLECKGSGKIGPKTCPECEGNGFDPTLPEQPINGFIRTLIRSRDALPILHHVARVGWHQTTETAGYEYNPWKRELEIEQHARGADNDVTVHGYGNVTPHQLGAVAGLLALSSDTDREPGELLDTIAAQPADAVIVQSADGLWSVSNNLAIRLVAFNV